MAKLTQRLIEALSKTGWQEINSTAQVSKYRKPDRELYIQPSKTHKGRYAIVVEYPDRKGLTGGMDQDTLIKYLTSDSTN
jgi:hypothetical protein